MEPYISSFPSQGSTNRLQLQLRGSVHGPTPSGPSRSTRVDVASTAVGASAIALARRRATRASCRADPSDLEKEAARIRAEALALEEEQKQQRREQRALEWTDGKKSISVAELRLKLQKEEKTNFSENEVRDLLNSKEASTENLSREEFQDRLRMLVAAKRETARALEAVAKREQEAEASVASMKEELGNVFATEVDGEDRSLPTRLVASLVYILPLMDGFQFGLPLLEIFPGALPIVKLIAPLLMLKNAIPFGTFIFLILFQAQARNGDLPQILRFNLAQAVVLDVLFIIPDFFMSIISMELPTSLLVALFVILFGVMVYSVTLTLLGKVPDGLGGISDMTRRNLGRGF